MMSKFKTIITTKGQAAISQAKASGTGIDFSKVSLGSKPQAKLSETDQFGIEVTKLNSEYFSFPRFSPRDEIFTVFAPPHKLYIQATITSGDIERAGKEQFEIGEIGVFAKDDAGVEFLVAYKYTDEPQVITKEMTFNLEIDLDAGGTETIKPSRHIEGDPLNVVTTHYLRHNLEPMITDMIEAGELVVNGNKLRGDEGPAGPMGPKGDTGPRGLKGDTGSKGAKGDKGDKGDTPEAVVSIESEKDGSNQVLKVFNSDGTIKNITLQGGGNGGATSDRYLRIWHGMEGQTYLYNDEKVEDLMARRRFPAKGDLYEISIPGSTQIGVVEDVTHTEEPDGRIPGRVNVKWQIIPDASLINIESAQLIKALGWLPNKQYVQADSVRGHLEYLFGWNFKNTSGAVAGYSDTRVMKIGIVLPDSELQGRNEGAYGLLKTDAALVNGDFLNPGLKSIIVNQTLTFTENEKPVIMTRSTYQNSKRMPVSGGSSQPDYDTVVDSYYFTPWVTITPK